MKKAFLSLLSVVLLAFPAAYGQQGGFAVQSSINWKSGTFELTVIRAMDPGSAAMPRAQTEAEAAIDSGFLGIFLESIGPMAAESGLTVGDLLASNPSYFTWMNALGRAAVKDRLSLTPDFTRLVAHYTFPIFGDKGIAAPFYPAQDLPVPVRLGYVPTRAFSGLVIYAGDPLPAVGQAGDQQLFPALFPRIFDADMNLVLDRSMMRPQALAKWGMVGYSDVVDNLAIESRAGKSPLAIAARAVFGTNSTDLVISNQAAQQLLTLPENIEMLKEGRILVIYKSLK
jgi:hypothetical protein